MDDLARFCCLNPACRLHGVRDAQNLYVRDRYGKDKAKRLLCCKACGARFSETKGTPLFGSKLPSDTRLSVLEHLGEGCGVRQTARLTKVNLKSVARLARKAGGHAKALHDELVAFSPSHCRGAVRRKVVVRRQEAGAVGRRGGGPGRRRAWRELGSRGV